MFNIVLVEPEIPANTGNIARTCSAIGAKLHLVKPLGFSIDDKHLKRAGLDYWDELEMEIHESLENFLEKYSSKKFYFSTTKAKNTYDDFSYKEGDFFIFGKETAGLPENVLNKYKESIIRIPMKQNTRSLNLSNSVAIIVYEALRQNLFFNLNTQGSLRSENDG